MRKGVIGNGIVGGPIFLQSRLVIYVEFRSSISTDELDKKLRLAFEDNIRYIIIGVDHKNFSGMSKVSLYNGYGVEKTAYELLSKGAEPISQEMRCAPCDRTWKAGGYRSSEGRFLIEGSEICKQCGNDGERVDSQPLAEMRP